MKYILCLVGGAIAGFIVGGLLIFFVFVGVPRSKTPPPEPSGPANPSQSGTATVTLDEPFFGAVLQTINHDINSPSFPLAMNQPGGLPGVTPAAFYQATSDCDGRIYVLPEGSGVRTAVQFKDGKIVAPLAFKGSYNFLGICVPFTGWAQGNIEMRFNEEKQTVYGQVNIESVNLDDTLAGLSNLVTPLVQQTINQRVNPVEILRAPQLALAINVKSSDGTLKAKVKNVKSEVANGELKLHIIYEFTGAKGLQPET
ncbi:MAG: hypothetical protein ABIP75_08675 [Pyrinomonadaceae bacterium]